MAAPPLVPRTYFIRDSGRKGGPSAGIRVSSRPIPEVNVPDHPRIPYRPPRRSGEEMLRLGRDFEALMDGRRSVRDFSPDPVPRELIEIAIRTASSAPSGAHRQPWRFVAVDDPAIKREIRVARA